MASPLLLLQRGICRARTRVSLPTAHIRTFAVSLPAGGRNVPRTHKAPPRTRNPAISRAEGPLEEHVPRRDQKQIDRKHVKSAKREKQYEATEYKDLLPDTLFERLREIFPHVESPTRTQLDFMRAIWNDQDVFLKDMTGSGKTFALVLAVMSRCMAAEVPSSGPSHLFLLPSPTLVEQVATWISSLQTARAAPLALALLADKPIEADQAIPPILLTTPNLLLPHLESAESPFSAEVLIDSLQTVVVDEVDAMLRPIPGRYTPATAAQHPFYLHPPAAVRALRPLLDCDAPTRKGRKGGRMPIQTVWMSASLNVPVKNWIFHQGWVARGLRQLVSLDGTARRGEEEFATPKERMTNDIKHHLIAVDVITGKLSDVVQPAEAELAISSAIPAQPVAAGTVHPLVVEALASLWAASEAGVSIVVPPEGSSTPKLLEALAALGVQAMVHGDSPPVGGKNALYVVSRSQVRGLDLPSLDTVYILGGLDSSQMSKNTRQHGGQAEKEKEYRHILGRVGRMGRQAGNGVKQKVVCLVQRNSPEHRAFEEYVAGSKGQVVLDPWEGELL